MACLTYKSARRGILLLNLILLIFGIVFMAVGAASLVLGQSFGNAATDYCQKICTKTEVDQVACNCDINPVQTTLPIIVFQAPATGIITLSVFLFIAAIIGLVGAFREHRKLLIAYGVFLVLIMIIQFGFGTAAAAVAGGSAAQITGTFMGVLNENYKYFDWKMLQSYFPSACYYASANSTVNDPFTGNSLNMTFHFPACDFYGKCANYYAGSAAMSTEEKYCCDMNKRTCDTSRSSCMSGYDCVMSFMGNVAAPIAIVAFLALFFELSALVCFVVVWRGLGTASSATVEYKA
mmetsp:Transcript_81056/g.217723  ORF Transcript_81056/g.217723 Transcript_81056/m.217723 type:complete len:293 (+) Transcript_81056:149-1027(+)